MSSDRRALARRLLLEGLVIVASILLAFAVDASWDGIRDGQRKDFLAELAGRERQLWQERVVPYLSERVDGLRYAFPDEARDRTARFPSGARVLYDDRTFQNLLLLRAGTVSSQLGLDSLVLQATDEVLGEIDRLR